MKPPAAYSADTVSAEPYAKRPPEIRRQYGRPRCGNGDIDSPRQKQSRNDQKSAPDQLQQLPGLARRFDRLNASDSQAVLVRIDGCLRVEELAAVLALPGCGPNWFGTERAVNLVPRCNVGFARSDGRRIENGGSFVTREMESSSATGTFCVAACIPIWRRHAALALWACRSEGHGMRPRARFQFDCASHIRA